MAKEFIFEEYKLDNDLHVINTEGNEEFPLGLVLTLIYLFAKIEIGYGAEYQ